MWDVLNYLDTMQEIEALVNGEECLNIKHFL